MTCELCGRDMSDDKRGCSCTHIKFEPKECSAVSMGRNKTLIIPRARVGADADMFDMQQYAEMKQDRCCDCGAPVGTFHHSCCDNETCPRCGYQLLSCSCDDEYYRTIMLKLFSEEPRSSCSQSNTGDSN